MAIVGYFEGTDPLVLTKLASKSIGTLPLSNGFDKHGKYVNHLTRQDDISVVVGYLHKVLPTPQWNLTPGDLLFACLTHQIPVLLIVENQDHEEARRVLGDVGDRVTLVDPASLYQTIVQTIF